jgi:hypothetical protein
LSKILASMLVIHLATFADADAVKRSSFKILAPRHGVSMISVFTYVAGGPRSRAQRPRLVDDAAVRVKRSGTVIREVKRTTDGHIVLFIKPGVYEIEAAIEPPAATPRIRCGETRMVRVHNGRKAHVKFYCPVP